MSSFYTLIKITLLIKPQISGNYTNNRYIITISITDVIEG